MLEAIDVAHVRASQRGIINLTVEQEELRRSHNLSAFMSGKKNDVNLRYLRRFLSQENMAKVMKQKEDVFGSPNKQKESSFVQDTDL